MQNPILKFRQSSIVFEKASVFSGKLKALMSSNCHRVRHFLLKLRTRFYLLMPIKGCSGFFLILFRSWVICKNKKDLVSTHSFFTFLSITKYLNK